MSRGRSVTAGPHGTGLGFTVALLPAVKSSTRIYILRLTERCRLAPGAGDQSYHRKISTGAHKRPSPFIAGRSIDLSGSSQGHRHEAAGVADIEITVVSP